MRSNSIETASRMCYQESSIGIQPLAVCQSMDHGHTAEGVTTDTFFEKMCFGLKSNLVWK